MSRDQRTGILSLIPKKGRDVRKLKNWRPLTLLNSDYKIYTKALATRLQKVLPNIIAQEQAGCMKGRSTFNNIRSTIDIINYTNENRENGILAYIDFEKAFDTIKWKFMENVLKKLNFGPKFQKYVNIMYQNIQACIINNGYASKFFETSRGIRQGCPISANLFILVVEVLAHKIRNNNNIKGIRINGIEFKLSQYADDTCLYLNNEKSLKYAIQVFQKFTTCSGLKVNKEKSEAIWIGASSNYRHKPLGLKWTKGATYLGIYISNDIQKATETNFQNKMQNIEDLLKMWTLRKLTLRGKVQIVNTLVISQLLYVGTVMVMPKGYLEKIKKNNNGIHMGQKACKS
jgi:hypothetical protein